MKFNNQKNSYNKTKGVEFEVNYNLSDRQREIILAGGTLAYMKEKSR